MVLIWKDNTNRFNVNYQKFNEGAHIHFLISTIHLMFSLDTGKYLKKGGRVSLDNKSLFHFRDIPLGLKLKTIHECFLPV